MADVAEEVVSGLHNHNSETHFLYKERTENAKVLHKVESQAVAGFRKMTEEAQNFATDLRGNINSLLKEFAKSMSDTSNKLRKNMFDASKVSSVLNACGIITNV